MRIILWLLLVVLSSCGANTTVPRWGKVEISFQGPRSTGLGEPNPFAIPFDVVFQGPNGKSYKVPGFYDGDGKGGLDGDVWKVRFSPDRNGAWSYQTESAHSGLNGKTGRFTVVDPETTMRGRLEYVGRRFLKFREGNSWLKFGADEPENFLGKAFGLDDWDAKKRQIDYLASKKINSVYIMTHNLEGDEKDVWPWVGKTQEEAKRNDGRFDVAKLDKWRDFFEYIQAKGIVIQLVLQDDSAWSGYNHARYYREIVARFGYLPALYFNFCEEYNETYSLDQALGYMKLLEEIDPYKHPRAIHNVNIPKNEYLDSPHVSVASIQTDPRRPASLNQLAVEWWEACLARKQRPLVVSFDEARPAEDRRSWWSVYLGGAMWESLILVPEGFAASAKAWEELAATRTFLESLPFDQMHPANHVVTKGQAFCLAQPGEVYAFYLPEGGTIEVDLAAGNHYRAEWFDPRSGEWRAGREVSGGKQTLAAPDRVDWAARITKINGNAKAPPTAASARISSKQGGAAPVFLAAVDPPEPHEYEIVTPPRHGKLSGTGAERVYTPAAGFTGQDRFEWRVKGPGWVSNTGAVLVAANASGVNAPPRAHDQTITVRASEPQTFILRYTDPDGPGPYRIRIVTRPRHGTMEGIDNDVNYTPAAGFKGVDQLEWLVSDGEGRSNRAKVRIVVQ